MTAAQAARPIQDSALLPSERLLHDSMIVPLFAVTHEMFDRMRT